MGKGLDGRQIVREYRIFDRGGEQVRGGKSALIQTVKVGRA
ncbi:TPA: hypothetical protein ACP5W0_001100 [Vibrio parahaemolyticus]